MKIFLFILLFFSALSAQQLITVVDSSTFFPLADVHILNIQKTLSSTSNSKGEFDLSLFNPGDTLLLKHLSYKEKFISYKEAARKNIIPLSSIVIPQDEVEIIDEKYSQSSTSFSKEIKLSDEEKNIFTNIGDLIQREAGILIRDYGSIGGVKTVSSRGLGGENTIVLFNEARVNDLRTGLFDLSSVSASSIDKILFVDNFDETLSSTGGILKLYSPNIFSGRKLNLITKLNSDLYQSAAIDYRDGRENAFFIINGERSYSSNHFNYRFNDLSLQRENAHFNKSLLSGNFIFNSGRFKACIYSSYYYLKSGIPGYVVTNNYASSRALNTSRSLLAIVNGELKLSDQFSFSSVFSGNNQKLLIEDPDGIIVYRDDKLHSQLNDILFQSKIKFQQSSFSSSAGYEYGYSSLNNITSFISYFLSNNFIEKYSHKFFLSAEKKLISPVEQINSITLSVKGSFEFVNEKLESMNKTNNSAFGFGLSVIPDFPFYLNIKSNYSSSYRFPTFNERFYSSLFNHYNLNKESYNSVDAGIEAEINSTSLSAVYYWIDGRDKIIWIPTRLSLQSPRNIGRILNQGLELIIKQKLFKDKVEASFIYNFTDARNKTGSAGNGSYNKLLIYTPQHRFNFNSTITIDDFTFSIFTSYTGKRFFTSDNIRTSMLQPFFIADAALTYNFVLLNRKHSAAISAFNIFNEEYFIIQSYPMPLRTFLISINMEII